MKINLQDLFNLSKYVRLWNEWQQWKNNADFRLVIEETEKKY